MPCPLFLEVNEFFLELCAGLIKQHNSLFQMSMSVTSTMEAVQTSVRMTMEASLVHVVQGMSLSLEIAVISSTQSGHAKVHNSGVCVCGGGGGGGGGGVSLSSVLPSGEDHAISLQTYDQVASTPLERLILGLFIFSREEFWDSMLIS